jgi:hypothetical protein
MLVEQQENDSLRSSRFALQKRRVARHERPLVAIKADSALMNVVIDL